MGNILENCFKVVTSPQQTFIELKENGKTIDALKIVILVSIFNIFMTFSFQYGVFSLFFFTVKFPFVLLLNLLNWVILSYLLYLPYKIFESDQQDFEYGVKGQFSVVLTLLGYCIFPLILLAPCEILKNIQTFGYLLGVICEVLVYLYVIKLIVQALKVAFEIKTIKAFVLLLFPFIYGSFGFLLAIDFFYKMGYIFRS